MLPLEHSSLVAAVEAGKSFSYRFFWGHKAREGEVTDACFSQWWPCRFELDGSSYTSAEQWMMASKARLFGDEATLAQIMSTDQPDRAKKLGRQVKGFDEGAWAGARFDLVTRGNIAKFGQSARLKKHLLSTGDEVLVEASPYDRIWGIGLSREAPDAADPRSWRGENLLGFALVRARAVLRGDLPEP